jgi:predicted protein tyrosine phosphatase
VCHQNRRRSATAERLFAKRADLEVRSAGTSEEALARVNSRMLEWADLIFVMEDRQRDALEQMFPDNAALERVVCLQIPDEYRFLDGELVRLLQERVAPYLNS